jgi:hypothetical protein
MVGWGTFLVGTAAVGSALATMSAPVVPGVGAVCAPAMPFPAAIWGTGGLSRAGPEPHVAVVATLVAAVATLLAVVAPLGPGRFFPARAWVVHVHASMPPGGSLVAEAAATAMAGSVPVWGAGVGLMAPPWWPAAPPLFGTVLSPPPM